jgi:2-alkyl-3-oxoalkanoate reductase
MAMRAVVTGGGGFLGSRIVSMLLDEGFSVSSFSRNEYPQLMARGVKCYAGDLADARAVRAAIADTDVVFHVAAKTGIWGSYAEYYATNVVGTHNVIEACRRHGVKKLVYTSTPSVVFSGFDMRNTSEDVPFPTKYLNHYACTKAEAERLVIAANGPALATVALRPHIIWGPGDTQLLPRLLKLHRARRLVLVGRGDNLVDTTFVDNAARAHVEAAKRLCPGGAVAGKAYFISQGDPRPMRSMLNGLLAAVGLPPVHKSIPVSAAYGAAWLLEKVYGVCGIASEPPMTLYLIHQLARDHYFDISAARRDLGYYPAVSIEEGMRRMQAAMAADSLADRAQIPMTCPTTDG